MSFIRTKMDININMMGELGMSVAKERLELAEDLLR